MQIIVRKSSRSSSARIYSAIRFRETIMLQRQQIRRFVCRKDSPRWIRGAFHWFLTLILWKRANVVHSVYICRLNNRIKLSELGCFFTIRCWWCIFFCTLRVKCLNSWLLPAIAPLPERWPSGRRRSPAKGVYPEGYRGFESHPLRHNLKIPANRQIFWPVFLLFCVVLLPRFGVLFSTFGKF